MTINEKIALLASVNIIMPADSGETELNNRIVDHFRQLDIESHEFLITANASSEEILDAAVAKIQENASSQSSSGTVMSANAYETSSVGGAPSTPASTGSGTALTETATKTKSSSEKKDVTSFLAGSLPTSSRTKLDDMVNQRWNTLMAMAKNTTVGAYCVDTEVRKYLLDKTFVVNNDDYVKTFLEKYNASNVLDDNEYGEGDTLVKKGDNMTAYENIVSKLQRKGTFNVRVPEVQNQKVIGVVFNRTGGDTPEIIKPMKDVPIFVLTEMGGKVPGQPGIEVTGIISTSSSKTKNGIIDTTEKQSIAIKHRGKVDAMKAADSKYIRYTAQPLDPALAKREFGAEQKEYSVSSVDSFRYKDKEGKEHVVRVRGKVPVPFFARLEQYMVFGSITASNRVEALTEADKNNVAKLYAAAFTSPHLQYEFASAAGLSELVADIEKDSGTPAFNATNIG
jgi:hypothetical protein